MQRFGGFGSPHPPDARGSTAGAGRGRHDRRVMSRFLFAALPADGHVAPLLPLARERSDRGHEVLWYTGRRYRRRRAVAVGRAARAARGDRRAGAPVLRGYGAGASSGSPALAGVSA